MYSIFDFVKQLCITPTIHTIQLSMFLSFMDGLRVHEFVSLEKGPMQYLNFLRQSAGVYQLNKS